MNASEILEIINAAEQDDAFCVLDWRAEDLRLWPLIRIRLFIDMWAQAHGARAAAPVGGALGKLRAVASRTQQAVNDYARQFAVRVRDMSSNDDYRRSARVLFVSNGVSFSQIDGRWVERICDPLIAEVGRSGLTHLLWTLGNQCLTPRLTPSAYIQPLLDLANASGMLRAWRGHVELSLPGYERFVARLRGHGVSSAELTRARLASDAARLHVLRARYERVLQRVRPRLVAIAGYYGLEMMALVAACRRQGVRTVDLQHGMQGDLHVAYGRWSKVPESGFELLPDFFWCWSDAEARAIDAWRHGRTLKHRALIGGNPWLELWRRNDDPMVIRYDAIVRETKRKLPGERHVLVTLQFGYEDRDFLDPLLWQAQRLPSNIVWWLRLHPSQLKQVQALVARVRQLGLTNVNVTDATQLPLYALLRHMDLHVTHSSSTVIEAEMFGVRSVIGSKFGAELFADEIARQVALFCELNVDGFAAAIASCGKIPAGAPGTDVSRIRQTLEMLLDTEAARPMQKTVAARQES